MPYDSHEIFLAFVVSITFCNQKNCHKHKTTIAERGLDPFFDLVAQIVERVWLLHHVPGTADKIQIYHYPALTGLQIVKQSEVLSFLMATACSIGENTLDFHPSEIGNKSARLGAAMAWFLDSYRPEHVMMMGRWVSTAFLQHSWKQVVEFSKGMTESILRPSFLALPTPAAGIANPRDPIRCMPARGPSSIVPSASLASRSTFNIH